MSSGSQQLLRCLAVVCLASLVFAGGPGQPGMIHFPGGSVDLETRVNEIEAKQAISEQRNNAITQSFSSEMSTLAKDSGAIKTTVTRLVEDSVQMMGRIRILQDVGSDVVGLRRLVTNMQTAMDNKVAQMQTQVNGVSGKLEQMQSANTYITVGLSGQMKQNKDLLRSLQATISQIDTKISQAEQKIAGLEKGSSGTSGTESLAGKVDELKETMTGYERTSQTKITNLEKELAELKQQIANM